jgi:retron-type reverse transcriptase
MILQVIYEPAFLDCSHGFRPKYSPHTAMKQVYRNFKVTSFIIRGNFTSAFKNIPHNKLMDIIDAKITDRQFTRLIQKSLGDVYFHFTDSQSKSSIDLTGTIKGSYLSPLLSNIFFDKFDRFIWDLKANYTVGKSPVRNPVYRALEGKFGRAKKQGGIQKARVYFKEMKKIPSKIDSPKFKRLHYVRYSDH